MKRALIALVLLMSPLAVSPAAAGVEPELNGTWKLEWPGSAMYWALRDDGTYRLFGPGAKPQQFGTAEAADDRWSIKSPLWQDGGRYTLVDEDTLQLTGMLGTALWKRVWVPRATAAEVPEPPAGAAPICALLGTDEVAGLLRAPTAIDAATLRSPGGCVFKSQFGQFDQLTITTGRVSPKDFQLNRQRTDGPPKAELPGLREGGYAEIDAGGYLVGHVLKGEERLTFRVRLTPNATLADAPYLAEIARAAERRWLAGVGQPPSVQPCCAGSPTSTPPRPPAPITNYQVPKLTDPLTTQQYAQAIKLHNAKRYAEALTAYLPIAERGDSRAQAMIGNIYYLHTKEYAKALPWYEKSAAQGNRQAEYYLGMMYGEGEGVKRDHNRSFYYYEAAAMKNMKESQAALGISYEFGYGVQRNRRMAILWFNRAARNGNGAGGYLADWLSRPDTPHFANENQLGAYINGKIGAWVDAQMGGGGASSSGGGSSGAPAGGGCAYSNPAACNAARAGDLWAADRIEQRRSSPSERSWYDR